MSITFVDLVKYIRFKILEKGYNELSVEFNDECVTFRLYDCEQVYISYLPFECDSRRDYKIIVGGLNDTLEDMTELTEIYRIVELIEKYRLIIDEELFGKSKGVIE